MIPPGVLAACDRVKPIVSITNPGQGSTQNGTITMSANATDNDKIKQVQFYLDGNPYGSVVTAAPYQVSVNTAALSSGGHTCSALATDRVGNTQLSPTVSWSAKDQHPPSVSIYSPANGATVYDTITFAASVSDDVGVAYVQYNIDGTGWTGAIGAPYQWGYDTHNLAAGGHTIYCLATDTAGNQTQVSNSFTVGNAPPAGSYVDMGSYSRSGDVERWIIDYYPYFNSDGGAIDGNPKTLPGNPNPTYYNMRARIFCHWFESPQPGRYQHLGLWLNGSRYPNGPDQQISSQDGENDQYGPYFSVSGGNYCWVERWGDAQDGCYTWQVHIAYDFTPKYAS